MSSFSNEIVVDLNFFKSPYYTKLFSGDFFKNAVVKKDVAATLQQGFCYYGYRNITGKFKEKS